MTQNQPFHWLESSQKNLLHNLKLIRKSIGLTPRIMAMVKANAYGHGLELITKSLSSHVNFFGVNSVSEALCIRKHDTTTPILITAPIALSSIPNLSSKNISVCVHSLEFLTDLSQLQLPLLIHLKINSGMNRLGITLVELLSALEIIRHSPHLTLEGIYTHLHSSDSNPQSSSLQLDLFSQSVFQARYYFPKVLAHAANSGAIFTLPHSHFDMVRPGISLYGLSPSPSLILPLLPILSWKCKAVQIRNVSAGEIIGYNASYSFSKSSTMAVLPVGYSDGYGRSLGNTGRVWADGSYFPVIGRVSMNFTTVDVSGLNNPESQTFELLGSHVTVDESARLQNSINYEIVSRLGQNIPRILT